MISPTTDAELRALEADDRAAVIELRDRNEALFRQVLRDGSAAGELDVRDVALATAHAGDVDSPQFPPAR